MILIKSKSTQDFRNQRTNVADQRQSTMERVSFSSLLKNNMHQSEARYPKKSRQISESKLAFPKKMLFSEIRTSVKRNSIKIRSQVDYMPNGRRISEYQKQNRNTANNLFSTLIKEREKTSILEGGSSQNLCTLSRETADSQYWSNPTSLITNQSKERRQHLKYFKSRQPVIRQKNRRSEIEKEVCNEYYYNHERSCFKEEGEISFGDLNDVNTSKQSIQFDMCPYL